MNRALRKASPFPFAKSNATAIGWKDRYVMQAAQPSVIDFGITPATLIGRTLAPSRNVAGAPAKRWRVTSSPNKAGWTGSGIGELEGMVTVTDGVIKVWYGLVRGNREYLIFRRMETIEQHARELLDLLDSEDPQEDAAERQVLLLDLQVEIEDRQDHWDADDAE